MVPMFSSRISTSWGRSLLKIRLLAILVLSDFFVGIRKWSPKFWNSSIWFKSVLKMMSPLRFLYGMQSGAFDWASLDSSMVKKHLCFWNEWTTMDYFGLFEYLDIKLDHTRITVFTFLNLSMRQAMLWVKTHYDIS